MASARAGHGGSLQGLTALAGILLGLSPLEKGWLHSEATAGSAAQPALAHAAYGSIPGAAQVLQHPPSHPGNQGWVSPSYPWEQNAPRRTHRETPVPASHSQLLAPSPGWSWLVLLSVPASPSASSWGTASARAQSQIPEQWEAAGGSRGKSSSCSFRPRTNCPAWGHQGETAKEPPLLQLCERRWSWGQHNHQLCHPPPAT